MYTYIYIYIYMNVCSSAVQKEKAKRLSAEKENLINERVFSLLLMKYDCYYYYYYYYYYDYYDYYLA